jgi:hypothetical protein
VLDELRQDCWLAPHLQLQLALALLLLPQQELELELLPQQPLLPLLLRLCRRRSLLLLLLHHVLRLIWCGAVLGCVRVALPRRLQQLVLLVLLLSLQLLLLMQAQLVLSHQLLKLFRRAVC